MNQESQFDQICNPPGKDLSVHDDKVLWRYISYETLLFHASGKIFIPSIETLRKQDPYEGEFHDHIIWFNTAFSKHFGNDAVTVDNWLYNNKFTDFERLRIGTEEKVDSVQTARPEARKRAFLEFIRSTRFAWCWFNHPKESAAMWHMYANRGVAITTTIGLLKSALIAQRRNWLYGQMCYFSELGSGSDLIAENQEADFLLKPFFLKRSEYEFEHEVRLVTCGPEVKNGHGIAIEEVPLDWIRSIHIWPGLSDLQSSSIKQTLKKLFPKAICERSMLYAKKDEPMECEDLFEKELKQLAQGNWDHNSDGVPEILKSL